ncbi:Sugar transferase probable phospho-glucosyltransferase [Bacillus thuringiensis]|uniref:Sugar transferase probable phospho-glucosyltransferase n=1 Tax=Bacillus thuringiensis TaxID=1428 RepID=A0A1C4GJ50_BACTU|nr:multidrug MFS transporter [Bacillus thuringiensis serovar wratislaviensis]OUB54034.1 multidrug MFS transporter [Bacillus thuringiensis serovar sylvestriensis]SCC68242.1 Sugar transferase probable phospho-glucosyltransferase [Bacillus thuringiensis]
MSKTSLAKIEILENEEVHIKKKSTSYFFIKRALDIIGAIIGLVIFSPFFIVIPLLFLIGENKGPVFFKQVRIGEKGKEFRIYKFRTMIVNAEEKLKKNKELYRKYLENNYKLEPHEDPRITKLGQFLRKTSLDEIPQFLNVLKGEMSLVGPRPVVVEELEEYQEKVHEFLSVKPGVTGYWQVSGRSDVGYPERVDLELYYVYNASVWFDIKILLLTVKNVLLSKGAY